MPSGGTSTGAAASPTRALVLATISFALSFAAWGLVGGLASVFTGLYRLTASQTALLVAVPVLLGSLARLPMGMLTDRFGGRLRLHGAPRLLVAGRLRRSADQQLRLAARARRSSSAWPGRPSRSARRSSRAGRRPARQGTALGVYGLGTMGQSLAVFVGPVVAARLGLADGVPRHRRAAPGLGGGLLPAGAQSAAGRPSRQRRARWRRCCGARRPPGCSAPSTS